MKGTRILFVDGSLRRAGAENLRLFVCRELARRGAELYSLVLGEPGEVAEDLRANHLAHVRLPHVGDSVKTLRPTLAIHRAVRDFRPQLVVASMWNCAFHSMLVTRGRLQSKIRLVIETFSTEDWMRPAHRVIWAGLLHAAHRVLACSQVVGDQLARQYHVPARRIGVAPSGADLHGLMRVDRAEARRKLGIRDDRPVVGSVGTLAPAKRYDRLLQAMRRLEDRTGERPWIVLSGHGPLRPDMEALAKTLGLSDRVVFTPRVDNVGLLYSALDLFVLPSDFEGIPLVIAEAMAMEVPVIASRVSGVPEIVEDRVTGRLFDPNDLDALTNLIQSNLPPSEETSRYATVAKKRAFERFTAERYAEHAIAIYEAALS